MPAADDTPLLGRRLASVRFDPNHEIEYVRGNNLTNSGPHRLVVTVEGRNTVEGRHE